MTLHEYRSPALRQDLAVLADVDAPAWHVLGGALRAQGFTVEVVAAEKAAFRAFVSGAAVVVLAPSEGPALAWLSLADRAARMLPAAAVWLPAVAGDANTASAAWLEVGFDEVLLGGFDGDAAAVRLAARARSRHVHHSLSAVDALTGLPTWGVFSSRLDPTVRLSSRAGMPMAVAVLDLDGFRAIEQSAGREAARDVLKDVSEHLRQSLRRSDTVARLGDDRFGLILHHITAFEARRLLYKLWRSLTLRPETLERLGESEGRTTFTAGVAVFPGDSSEGHELYTRAEIALDCARASGQRRVLLYSETSGEAGQNLHATDLRWHRTSGGGREEPE
jgi:diguanylate cyclase (GGDEF)-like protein